MDHDERRARWDRRYASGPHGHEPNPVVEQILAEVPAGTAVDLGAGSGRHALWLAERGWDVTAVDFSAVGLSLGEKEARRRGLSIDWVTADARVWAPAQERSFDLVLVSHLHVPAAALTAATGWLARGGRLLVMAHGERNLTDGVGGPSDPTLLYSVDGLRSAAAGLEIKRCEEVARQTRRGTAIDVVLLAQQRA